MGEKTQTETENPENPEEKVEETSEETSEEWTFEEIPEEPAEIKKEKPQTTARKLEKVKKPKTFEIKCPKCDCVDYNRDEQHDLYQCVKCGMVYYVEKD